MFNREPKYNQKKYHTETIKDYTQMKELSFQKHQNSAEISFKKQMLESEEGYIGMYVLQDWHKYSYEWFSLQQPSYDKIDSDAAFTINISVTKKYTMFTRQIYSGLDLIGDIGGLKDGLFGISSLLIQIQLLFIENPWVNFLLGSLFKIEQKRKHSNLSQSSQF